MNTATLTVDRLLEVVRYNPDTGLFSWVATDQRAGFARKDGYIALAVDGKTYRAHRLAWFLMHETWPELIDHINGDRSDNRFENLREATRSENTQNSTHTRSKSGYRGVSRNGKHRWKAAIAVNGRDQYLGTFDTPEEAHAAYCAAAAKLHTRNPYGFVG